MNQQINIEASMVFEFDEIQDITSAPIARALSFSMSLTKKFCVIGTENGFCLVDNTRKVFKRFENEKNPFHREKQTGVQLGSALQERSQVALIPSRNSKLYSKTTVYIFDHKLRTILYTNPFFLPIRQLLLTDQTILLSNNKRLILYNYTNDVQQKNQAYYLSMYASKEENRGLRFLEMSCEERFGNNSVVGEEERIGAKECLCGRFAVSGVKPYKVLYVKVYTMNGVKMIQLSVYNAAYDKDYVFESFHYNEPFSFTISEDGRFVAHSENNGRNVAVYKLEEKGVYCNLAISSSIKQCLTHGFFTFDDNTWYTVLRKGDNSLGTMHFFKLPHTSTSTQSKKQLSQTLKPKYRRYFSLFERTILDYGISDHLIGPDFYVVKGAVFAASVCGAVTQVIDFGISGNHLEKTSENLVKWVEDIS